MKTAVRRAGVWGILSIVIGGTAGVALANGGPFLVKYPNGDPAAKGILARLDPDLKPTREERLRVIKEDLEVAFIPDSTGGQDTGQPPLVQVSAAYTIENPTGEEITVDFGFPILRGLYMSPYSMRPRPDVRVQLNDQGLRVTVISNSAIYGIIRQRARELIEQAVADDSALAELVAAVRASGLVRDRVRRTFADAIGTDAALARAAATDRILADVAGSTRGEKDPDHQAARAALAEYLRGSLKWDESDVALMVEFASLDFGSMKTHPPDRGFLGWEPANELINANLGPLAAIGEQKATQFFAELAACFDSKVASTYESIFSAWGGDVRERSVDLLTGNVRPREITLSNDELADRPPRSRALLVSDPTIYARVDYFDSNANLSETEKASCKTVLKNLPVIFTFAPMNLLHYQATFPPKATQTLTVTYKQYAYADTREPLSHQLAYVVHPASNWKYFGPINLEVAVPEGVPFRASVACEAGGTEDRDHLSVLSHTGTPVTTRCTIHRATLNDKTGELFLAVGTSEWNALFDDRKEDPEEGPQRG